MQWTPPAEIAAAAIAAAASAPADAKPVGIPKKAAQTTSNGGHRERNYSKPITMAEDPRFNTVPSAASSGPDGMSHAAAFALAASAAKQQAIAARPPAPPMAAAKSPSSGGSQPAKNAGVGKVKMTELLAAISERLQQRGEMQKASAITATNTKYRSGELNYSQAMSDLTKVIGKELLVHEVTRLSQAAKEQAVAGSAVSPPANKSPGIPMRPTGLPTCTRDPAAAQTPFGEYRPNPANEPEGVRVGPLEPQPPPQPFAARSRSRRRPRRRPRGRPRSPSRRPRRGRPWRMRQ